MYLSKPTYNAERSPRYLERADEGGHLRVTEFSACTDLPLEEKKRRREKKRNPKKLSI